MAVTTLPPLCGRYHLILKQMKRREAKRSKAERPFIEESKLELAWGFHACAGEVPTSHRDSPARSNPQLCNPPQ